MHTLISLFVTLVALFSFFILNLFFDTIMDHADSSCLSWNEILNLIEKYHKVTSFLVGQDTLVYKNFILPKSLCYRLTRFNIHRTNASGKEREEGKESDVLIAKDARGRSGRKAQENIIKKEGSVRTDRSPEIETDVDPSYELQIKQISTCWTDNYESF